MRNEIDILLPMAGTLFGLALSLLLVRLRTLPLAGYSRKSYRIIEIADLKTGLMLTLIGILSIASAPLLVSMLRPLKPGIVIQGPPSNPLDSIIFRPPKPLDPNGLFNDAVLPSDNSTSTYGRPKPVDDNLASPESDLTPNEVLSLYSAKATPDSVIRMMAQARSDGEEMPAPNQYVAYDRRPQVLHIPQPSYPDICLKAGIDGTAVVNVLLNKRGEVVKVMLLKSSGNPALDEAALEAARQAMFTPAYQGDNPVCVWVSIPFVFKVKS